MDAIQKVSHLFYTLLWLTIPNFSTNANDQWISLSPWPQPPLQPYDFYPNFDPKHAPSRYDEPNDPPPYQAKPIDRHPPELGYNVKPSDPHAPQLGYDAKPGDRRPQLGYDLKPSDPHVPQLGYDAKPSDRRPQLGYDLKPSDPHVPQLGYDAKPSDRRPQLPNDHHLPQLGYDLKPSDHHLPQLGYDLKPGDGFGHGGGYDLHPNVAIGYDIKPAVPRDVMVDVINDLGINLLAIHNEHNDNNIALSPYGAISVLAALSEGLKGEAAHEILHAAHLPKDRHVVRVGLRDIHRHLKSYFIPPEGFLAGLTLNLSNVTLRTDYEDVLKFYGFDYDSFNNALYPEPPTTTTTAKSTRTPLGMKETTDSVTKATEVESRIGEKPPESTTVKETTVAPTTELETEVTTLESVETTKDLTETTIETTPKITTVVPSTTAETTETTTKETTTEPPTTTAEKVEETTVTQATTLKETTTTQSTTTEKREEVATTEAETTTLSPATEPPRTTREIPETTPTATTTVPVSTTEPASTTEQVTTTTQMSTTVAETTTITSPLETTTNDLTNVAGDFNTLGTTVPPFFDDSQTTTPFFIGTMPEIPQTTALAPENQAQFDYYNYQDVNAPLQQPAPNYEEVNPDLINTMTNVPQNLQPNVPQENLPPTNVQPNQQFTNNLGKRQVRSVGEYIQEGYFEGSHRHKSGGHYLPEDPKTFAIYEKYREPGINFMKYDTVLPFSYLPNLNALALNFPLDSSRYYLLLVLPVEENGVDRLVCDLRLHGGLKYIVENLRMSHVVATIPSFTLKGYVSLTPTLQKLGLRNVFEPRQSDFSPMTDEKNIYVTNIEQAVTVTIRNYLDPSAEHYKNIQQYDPAYFTADHPFLYFVLDADLNVALMVGKVVNPLNSRIR